MTQTRANIGVAEPNLPLCPFAAVTLPTPIDEHGLVGLASSPMSLRSAPARVVLGVTDRMVSVALRNHYVLRAA